jgi:hypothetical protein
MPRIIRTVGDLIRFLEVYDENTEVRVLRPSNPIGTIFVKNELTGIIPLEVPNKGKIILSYSSENWKKKANQND